jgi:hypothetical protein
MLKKISKLFLGLVVCAGSAYVTPTYASSATSVVLVHIQAAGPSNAKDEMISIFNNTSDAVDITDWCLGNKSNVKFACFATGDPGLAYSLPPHSFAVAASESFVTAHAVLPETITHIFTVTNQSSGSIVNSSDTISLFDKAGAVIDKFQWNTAIPSGKIAMRNTSGATPTTYDTLDPLLSWTYGSLADMPSSQVEVVELENELPTENPEIPEPETPVIVVPSVHPIITEVLPNPQGADAGNEFIELYNPLSDAAIALSSYVLRVGKELEKSYTFPATAVLQPGQYVAFYNSEIGFTLLNSTSRLQLAYDDTPVGEVIVYDTPKDDHAWAFVGETWLYTNRPTPNNANVASFIELDDEQISTSLKPCAANQYRSTETNRCRLITTATSSPQPCTAGQYRSPDTNRCRNLAAASSSLSPCKEGQERNAETNRCRNSVKMTNADYAVEGVTTSNQGISWYWWLGIGGIVASVVAYAVWEWRVELRQVLRKLQAKFARNKA